jgi:hypothetical protein
MSVARAVNISTRLQIESGENIAVGGFFIRGDSPKKVALRAMGPSLRSAGFGDSALADPVLQLLGPNDSLIDRNDNWRDNPASAAELEAAGLAPSFDSESAIVATLPPGAYTVAVAGSNDTSGVGMVEVYDLDPANSAQLSNISTRGVVRAGSGVIIAGFILEGETEQATLLIRLLGPSLAASGIVNALVDPVLELRDNNGALLQSNDNWQDTQQDAIEATGLAPQSSFEAAILATLTPGSYTAIAAGKGGGIGVGLIEVYNLSPH